MNSAGVADLLSVQWMSGLSVSAVDESYLQVGVRAERADGRQPATGAERHPGRLFPPVVRAGEQDGQRPAMARHQPRRRILDGPHDGLPLYPDKRLLAPTPDIGRDVTRSECGLSHGADASGRSGLRAGRRPRW